MMKDPVEQLLFALPDAMRASACKAADRVRSASKAVIASHIDADGISAAAIAGTTLARMEIDCQTMFFKKLDDAAVQSLRDADCDLVWFTDLGSGSLSKIYDLDAVITDHHAPDLRGSRARESPQSLLSDFATVVHVNPHLHGISGASDLSGAGATFLTAVATDHANADLSPLAILGSVGDLQNRKTRRLEGLNRPILRVATDLELVEAFEDIRYFGRETRPVFKMLEYSSDPFLPRIGGHEQEAISFLLGLGIELKDGESWRTWTMLSGGEKKTVIDALREHLIACRRNKATIERLVGETYSLTGERPGSPVRDMKEFATLLNACGRHGRAEIGMRICAGDRGIALAKGLSLLRDHRSALSNALELAKSRGITRMKHIQYFDAGDDIEETIVGTVAGMLLGSGGVDRTAPMIAFAESLEPGEVRMVKVSSRGTQDLISKGMDLSAAMRHVAEGVGGVGGGHNIAAGATIPFERKRDFLLLLDEVIGSQIMG
ncbi:MAG: DHH family phosphoesterase [Methanobacteriota archaeon]|nr:MAG: DHH family phosphoesterase [Euryarchaeota archaeon]